MSGIVIYRLRGASSDEIWSLLVQASAGRPRAYAFESASGARLFDEARIRTPWPETVATTGGEDAPAIETGVWFCEVALVGEQDAELSALSVP
ncbi:MAG: hypothetical protein K8R18_05855 [Parvibaculum sp.]|uniref:hypothetical protein n=1 Tax=Parvibaculum sp. TaxID=2024848 RepID=UPI0025F9CB90|nr:hypothetical protein [Parvibaculum sp.]MCE9649137.1 hypothetical protein [Parvibaculum sp.]